MTTRLLDWRNRSHWNGGRRKLCVHCGRLAFLLDDVGRPAHKVCAETTPDNQPGRR